LTFAPWSISSSGAMSPLADKAPEEWRCHREGATICVNMNDFPEFMKHPANRIVGSNQATAGVEGYVFPDERPDTLALKLFYNAASRDHLTTASAGEEGFARANGYYLVRIEGYVPRV